STIPDPQNEPELYTAVITNQIHTCNEKYRIIASQSQICKKGFPPEAAIVKLLTTEPPPTRSRFVLLAYMIDENDENPYYDNTIMKYMHCSLNPEFENLTYLQYFEQYSITSSQPTTSRPIYCDQLQNYVIKCTKEIIVRYHYLKLEDDKLLYSLNNQLPTNLHSIIQSQLETLKIFSYIFPLTATLELLANQYNTISIISIYIDRTSNSKWSYYFITELAGTGKSYIIYIIIKMLEQRNFSYLLLAPTGVAVQNVGGKTIYSELQIISTQTGFISKAFADKDFKTYLQKIDTLIIEEISIVSAKLLDFISNLFTRLYNNAIAFGRINVIVVANLFQLPPVSEQPVFKSATCDTQFFKFLEEVRTGRISTESWSMLYQCHLQFVTHPAIDILLHTTHIVDLKENA
ncbi:44112_t:CDS:2, partial [Gigaspora margarita]